MNTILFNYIFRLSTIPLIANIAIFLNAMTYVFLALVLLWSIFIAKHKMFTISLLFLSTLSAWLVAHALKYIFHVARPFVKLGFTPLIYQDNFSFPSEHTAVFAALATSVFFINKPAGIVLGVLALCIGFSRIILGVHYPADVLAGFVIGILVALLYIQLFKHI